MAIKESFNLKFPGKVIGGKKPSDTAESDASEGFRGLIRVSNGGVFGGHEREKKRKKKKRKEGAVSCAGKVRNERIVY